MDGYTREALAIEVDTSLPGARVVGVLQRLAIFQELVVYPGATELRASRELVQKV